MRLATFNILHGRSQSDDAVDLDRFAAAIASLDATCWRCRRWTATSPARPSRTSPRSPPRPWARPSTASSPRSTACPEPRGPPRPATSSPTARRTASRCSRATPSGRGRPVRLAPVPVRFPMRFTGSRRPELVRDEPRAALAATIEGPHGVITVANTHLTFVDWWNGRQLRPGPRLALGGRPALRADGRPQHGPRPRRPDHAHAAARDGRHLPGARPSRAARPRAARRRPAPGDEPRRRAAPVRPPRAGGRRRD